MQQRVLSNADRAASEARSDDAGPPLARVIGLFMGACFFAYLFGVAVHELGHYLADTVLGVPESGVVLHPFDLSENTYGGDTSQALRTPLRLAFSGAAGAGLNLVLAVTVGLALWRKRSPVWLPVLMWGAVALLQESVGMVIGLVDYPDLQSDWVDVMMAGVPPAAIGLLAAMLLIAGCAWMLLLLPLAGIRVEDAYWRKLVIFLAGIPLLLAGAVAYLSVRPSTDMVMQNRLIALVASLVLVVGITAVHKPVLSIVGRIPHPPQAHVTWRHSLVALGLGAAVFVFQLVFFN